MKNYLVINALNFCSSFLVLAGLITFLFFAPAISAQTAGGNSYSPEAESSKIVAADGTVNAGFGTGVALSGNTMVVGAPRQRTTSNSIIGAVYIYVRNGNQWIQQAEITPPIPGQFGISVAISGDTVIVGANFEEVGSNSTQGAAYIYVRSGENWSFQQKITASDGLSGSQFGNSVAIDENTALIGAFRHRISGNEKGAAYIFTRTGGIWTQQAQLIDSDGNIADRFGFSVAIDNGTAVVGSPSGDPVPNSHDGVACVFSGSGALWTQQSRLSSSDASGEGDWFGTSVDIDSDKIIVGARYQRTGAFRTGAAYIFKKNGENWTQQQKLFDANNSSSFGISVSISGDTVIVGSLLDQIGTFDNKGSAYVYFYTSAGWRLQARLISSDGGSGDNFGASVAVDSDKFVAGTPGADIGTNLNQGAVYYFFLPIMKPDLQSAADSGLSSTDNLTNVRTLPFDIGGVTSGATVELLRNGVVVSSAVAGGGSITLIDADVPADGIYKYTGRQIVNGETGSDSEATVVTIDTAAPVVTINQEIFQSDPTTNASVVFKVIFNEPVTGFDISDVSFADSTADLSGVEFQILSTNPSIYTVGIYRITADNRTVVANIPAGSVSDAAGNFNLASTGYDNSVTVDNVSPSVTINQAVSQTDPTAVLPINFTVVFSEPVTGFGDSFDVSLNGSTANTSGASITITGSGTTYNVAVGGITSNGQNIRIAIQSGAAQDSVGNRNLFSTSTDNIVTLDNVRPNVTINQAPNQADPTSEQPLNFRVIFNESVIGFDSSDISLNGSTANVSGAQIVVTGGGTTYNVAVSRLLSGGIVRASIAANAAQDSAGNPNNASTSSDNAIIYKVKGAAFDFDGDSKADISVFRPGGGNWYLLQSQAGFTGIQFGDTNDKLAPADYDGDGKTDLAVYRSGIWYLNRSSLGFIGFAFGDADDIPQPADFDGDGKAELAVWRPSNGTWYVYNLITGRFTSFQFGASTDKPVASDYDGDGKADYAVFRPTNGVWYLQRSTAGFIGTQFGEAADKPVAADYDGDGKTDIAVYRPSNGTWYLLQSAAGFTGVQFGISTDLPTPADYDGDGKTDVAVYRAGIWYLQQSTNGFTGIQFGADTDKPIPNVFVQ